MPGFELIIFDCDGVLVDSEIIAAEVEAKLLTQAGYPITAEEISERFSGLTWKDSLFEIEQISNVPLPATLIDDLEPLLDEKLGAEVRAIDGVAKAVGSLSGPRCICSNSTTKRLKSMLARTGLDRLFGDHVYSARDTGEGRTKPAPDIYIYGAAQFGADPANILVIEDSVHGVEAARAAGMRVVGFTGGSHSFPGHADKLTEAGAETVIARMADLPATIAALAEWSEVS